MSVQFEAHRQAFFKNEDRQPTEDYQQENILRGILFVIDFATERDFRSFPFFHYFDKVFSDTELTPNQNLNDFSVYYFLSRCQVQCEHL